jgi:hypothetical protein
LLSVLSVVRTWQGRLDEAESLSNQAVAILSAVGELVQLGQSRQNLGRVQMEEGRLALAETTLELAIDEHRHAHNPGGIAIGSCELAEVLLREGKLTEAKAALSEYDRVFKGRRGDGEHVTHRAILAAFVDVAGGATNRAQSEAIATVKLASKRDQGSMLMEATLALGEVELGSADQLSGRRKLEALVRDADSKGFGLISRKARQLLAHASGRSDTNHSEPPIVALSGGAQTISSRVSTPLFLVTKNSCFRPQIDRAICVAVFRAIPGGIPVPPNDALELFAAFRGTQGTKPLLVTHTQMRWFRS